MSEIDVIDWLESRVPSSESEVKLHSMALLEITKLRKRVNELERQLAQRNIESKGFLGAHE